MNGVVTGGWNFVWAAYGVTAAILLAYSVSVIRRFSTRDEHDKKTGATR